MTLLGQTGAMRCFGWWQCQKCAVVIVANGAAGVPEGSVLLQLRVTSAEGGVHKVKHAAAVSVMYHVVLAAGWKMDMVNMEPMVAVGAHRVKQAAAAAVGVMYHIVAAAGWKVDMMSIKQMVAVGVD